MLASEILSPNILLHGKPALFVVTFFVLKPTTAEVILVDMDPARPGVCYACQQKTFTKRGKHVWRIPIPIAAGKYFNEQGEDLAPKHVGFAMRIIQTSEPIGNYIALKSLVVKDYKLKPTGFDKKKAEFSKFSTEFALMAPYLATGRLYHSENGTYQIDYVEHLTNPENPVTPARRGEGTNYMQAQASLMRKKPVPRNKFTLNHEFSHEDENSDPDNESQADINAAKMMAKEGWPEYEGKMSLQKTFENATPQGWQAMNNPGLTANIMEQKHRQQNLENFYSRSNFLQA